MVYTLEEIQNAISKQNYVFYFDAYCAVYRLRSRITGAEWKFTDLDSAMKFIETNLYKYHGYDNMDDFNRYGGVDFLAGEHS